MPPLALEEPRGGGNGDAGELAPTTDGRTTSVAGGAASSRARGTGAEVAVKPAFAAIAASFTDEAKTKNEIPKQKERTDDPTERRAFGRSPSVRRPRVLATTLLLGALPEVILPP
jgi:hypothetical protein